MGSVPWILCVPLPSSAACHRVCPWIPCVLRCRHLSPVTGSVPWILSVLMPSPLVFESVALVLACSPTQLPFVCHRVCPLDLVCSNAVTACHGVCCPGSCVSSNVVACHLSQGLSPGPCVFRCHRHLLWGLLPQFSRVLRRCQLSTIAGSAPQTLCVPMPPLPVVGSVALVLVCLPMLYIARRPSWGLLPRDSCALSLSAIACLGILLKPVSISICASIVFALSSPLHFLHHLVHDHLDDQNASVFTKKDVCIN